MLQGLEQLIEEKTGITTMTADDPMTAVAIGTGQYIELSLIHIFTILLEKKQ